MLLVLILTCEYVLKDWEFSRKKKKVVGISAVQWEVIVMAVQCSLSTGILVRCCKDNSFFLQ